MTKQYDLEERTATFGEAIIDFAKTLPKNEITRPLISQLVRAGTSVGANYLEADAGSTKKDFQYKITLSRKEAKETRHWLRMIVRAVPEKRDEVRILWKEAQEFVLIVSSAEYRAACRADECGIRNNILSDPDRRSGEPKDFPSSDTAPLAVRLFIFSAILKK